MPTTHSGLTQLENRDMVGGIRGRGAVIRVLVISLAVLSAEMSLAVQPQEEHTSETALPPASEERPAEEATAESGPEDPGTTAVESASEEIPVVEPDWEVRPYAVLVTVSFTDRGGFTAEARRQILETVRRRIKGVFGPLWKLTLEEDDTRAALGAIDLHRLTDAGVTETFLPSTYDKVLQLSVDRAGAAVEVSGCEWDRSTQTLGAVVGRSVIDRRQVAEQLSQLAMNLFRPLTRVDLAEESSAELRVMGGEFLDPQAPSAPFLAGDLLIPFFRYLDRDKTVRQIQMVPWTYLVVESVDRSRLMCRIESAFPAPISGTRRRVELVAIKVRPRYPATQLTLQPRVPPFKPLVGLRVEVFGERPVPGEEWPDHLSLMSSREGTVTIPAQPEHPLRYVYVFSGDAVLAQSPFVPGIAEETTIQLPDDGPRLSVEGQLIQIQGDLIDLVARRTVQMARAVSLAKKGEEWETVDALMLELSQQPKISQFRSRIVAAREPALARARGNRDRSAEKRIGKMCRDLQDLVDKYLAEDKLRVVREEVDELRKLSPAR